MLRFVPPDGYKREREHERQVSDLKQTTSMEMMRMRGRTV
jgi:hypothetical protein